MYWTGNNPAAIKKGNAEMAKKKLLIVESPSKASTIKKYLGSDYTVMASVGHIIDLPKSQLGVDIDNNFEPKYITIRGKGPILTDLKKEAAKADKVYLATDPDREGEAISWHLANTLKIDASSPCRVTFNEITKTAVKAAVREPKPINMDLVNAQQARRVLDRIVGYKISPILWEKIKKGLSAGRVQSAALKMVCDREEEIINFVPEEYWSVTAECMAGKKGFSAKYYGEMGKETKLPDKASAYAVLNDVKDAQLLVEAVKRSTSKRNPQPPFTTSTLQQDASRKINFSTSKTMQIAQQLYEGISLGGSLGTVGLITYMRTDSLRISAEAQKEAVDYLTREYGSEYVNPRQYKTRSGAQDAHEAIRPTSVGIVPASVKNKLTPDQYKLYKLIWERFAASQMAPAVYDTMQISIASGTHTFRASGSSLKFKGYTAVYIEGTDEKNEKEKMLPPMEEGQKLTVAALTPKQHFTQPPARYTEASLVKALEENGIGRPSTYAPTLTTIISRGYVIKSKKLLMPTELGEAVNDIMRNNFEKIVDIGFTAGMEDKLDLVGEGKLEWRKILKDFYPDFSETLEQAKINVEKIKIKDEESDVICEKCGRRMVYKLGKFGKFLACPGFPECQNTKTIREGTGVMCPKCGGEILKKKSRRGKEYYACEHLPKCDFMAWDAPVKDKKCPECGGILLRKKGRRSKVFCINEDCGYEKRLTAGEGSDED